MFVFFAITPLDVSASVVSESDYRFVRMNEVENAMSHATRIDITAYVLSPRGRMARMLRNAAARGTKVNLVLDGQARRVSQSNRETAITFNAQGINTTLSAYPLHAKIAIVDRTVYWSDRNWASRDRDEAVIEDHVVADFVISERAVHGISSGQGQCSTRKADALSLEEATIRSGDGHEVDVQTEAYTPGTKVESAMLHRASHGAHIRFIVSSQELRRSPREARALQFLVRHGIDVRVSRTAEKMAVVGRSVWIGSANMTPGVRDQIDWGIRLPSALVSDVQARFTRNWNEAQPIYVSVF